MRTTLTTLIVAIAILASPFLGTSLQAQNVHIPDAGFKAWLLDRANINTNGDNEIQLTEAEAYTGDISLFSCSDTISDLTGIEAFKNLTSLDCNMHAITSLDVSNLHKLEELDCHNNKLTSLNLGENTLLTKINCRFNQLTSLDIPASLTKLEILDCSDNQLSNFDPNHLVTLVQLYCDYNNLTTLNVSNLTALNHLSFAQNELTSIDVSKNTNLTSLNCSKNQLTNLDLSENTNLEVLNCSNNQLTNIDINHLKNMRNFICWYNQLTSLDISGLNNLISISCHFNQLTTLNFDLLSPSNQLRTLSCSHNQLTDLDVSNLKNLTSLNCYNNQLSNLNIANGFNDDLSRMHAYNNPDLSCIQIDAGFTPPASPNSYHNWRKDATTDWSTEACNPESVEDMDTAESSLISPNPFNNYITISNIDNLESINIYNINGQEVKRFAPQKTLDLSELNSQIYFVQLLHKDGKIEMIKAIKH